MYSLTILCAVGWMNLMLHVPVLADPTGKPNKDMVSTMVMSEHCKDDTTPPLMWQTQRRGGSDGQ